MITIKAITIKELLAIMDSGATFSLTVVAYNRAKKTGGQILEYPEAQLLRAEEAPSDARPPTAIEEKQARLRKPPNHSKWYTRNIQMLVNGQPTNVIRKIHPPLILTFNGQNVVV